MFDPLVPRDSSLERCDFLNHACANIPDTGITLPKFNIAPENRPSQ